MLLFPLLWLIWLSIKVSVFQLRSYVSRYSLSLRLLVQIDWISMWTITSYTPAIDELGNWLSVLPLREHGFDLHKGSFEDALCLRYGWHPLLLPINCVCNKSFTAKHALSCSGYPILRHNKLGDITVQYLDKTCSNVIVLQSLSGESVWYTCKHTCMQIHYIHNVYICGCIHLHA